MFLSLTPHTRLLMRAGAHSKKWGNDREACTTSPSSPSKFGVLCSQPQPCPSPPCSPQPQRAEPGWLPLTWALTGPLPGFQLRFPSASSLPQQQRQPVTCPSSAARGAGLAWPHSGGGGAVALTGKGRANNDDYVRQMKSAGRGGEEDRERGVWLPERLGPSQGEG